jgi:isocitrate/isopropylmalate dehydrogenase
VGIHVWHKEAEARPEGRTKCTLIPGDGVGPELMYSVQEVFKVMTANNLIIISSMIYRLNNI